MNFKGAARNFPNRCTRSPLLKGKWLLSLASSTGRRLLYSDRCKEPLHTARQLTGRSPGQDGLFPCLLIAPPLFLSLGGVPEEE